jgi:hypothetical protein
MVHGQAPCLFTSHFGVAVFMSHILTILFRRACRLAGVGWWKGIVMVLDIQDHFQIVSKANVCQQLQRNGFASYKGERQQRNQNLR